jgi:hypothetical protein
VLSARIQELYGVNSKFTLGHGLVAVKIEVLAHKAESNPPRTRVRGALRLLIPIGSALFHGARSSVAMT